VHELSPKTIHPPAQKSSLLPYQHCSLHELRRLEAHVSHIFTFVLPPIQIAIMSTIRLFSELHYRLDKSLPHGFRLGVPLDVANDIPKTTNHIHNFDIGDHFTCQGIPCIVIDNPK